jgi:hypothetical protein
MKYEVRKGPTTAEKSRRINQQQKPTTRRHLDVQIFSSSSARVSMFVEAPGFWIRGTDLCLPTPQGPSERLILP